MLAIMHSCIYKLGSNFLHIFGNLSESDCSQSKSDCNCLQKGCLPSINLCNGLAIKSGHECAAPSNSGQLFSHHRLQSFAECEKINLITRQTPNLYFIFIFWKNQGGCCPIFAHVTEPLACYEFVNLSVSSVGWSFS